jgi:hypothetical protein
MQCSGIFPSACNSAASKFRVEGESDPEVWASDFRLLLPLRVPLLAAYASSACLDVLVAKGQCTTDQIYSVILHETIVWCSA